MKSSQSNFTESTHKRARPWIMSMQWHDLLFMHWSVPVDVLRPHIPSGLRIDTFEGDAYVAVVPFVMRHVRPRGCPSVPGISFFPEINLRTYVTAQDKAQKSGVWFFSLDAHNPLAVRLARTLFHLPYFDASVTAQRRSFSGTMNNKHPEDTEYVDSRTHHEGIYYKSVRQHKNAPRAVFEGYYQPIGEVFRAQEGSLEYFLTERYCLYSSDARGRLYRGDIQHAPWSLQLAEVKIIQNSLHEAWDIPLQGQPLLHVARSLDVRACFPKRIR